MFGSNKKQKSPLAPLWKRGIQGDLTALISATCLALFLAPGVALAQNECELIGVDPSVNGATADSYDCDQASYPDGVTYNADGNLTVEFTNGGITEVEDIGIDLSATGGDSIFFDSQSTETEIESRAVTGPLLSVTTVNGDIDIDTEEMDADGQTPQGVTHAIFAESTGSGSIDINTVGTVDANGSNPADSIGIQGITTSGSLTITAAGAVSGNGAAIDATTGIGLLTINVASGSGTVGGFGNNVGIRADAGGDAVINIASGRTVSVAGAGAVTALDLSAVGETIVNNAGFINGGPGVAIQTGGGALVLNNDDQISGILDFSGLTSGYTFNNNADATWDSGLNTLSELGAGTLNNAGTIEISRTSFISAPGTTFTGLGASQLIMGAVLDGDGRMSCTDAIAADTFSSTTATAGCLDLIGGATTGQTSILIDGANSNPDPFAEVIDTPLNPGIVLVDVGGGTSAAEHFVLDSGSDNYAADSVYGGVVQTGGLFDYALLYNPNTQQHLLASVPQHEALEYAALIHESLSVWHTTSDAVAGRQADLRDGGQRGGWVRVFTGKTERDFKPTVTTHGNTFTYDRSYELDTRGAVAGYDLTADDSHVLGVHLGFLSTRLEHDSSQTVDETTFPSSVTFGAYGGWWNETGLTLDGTLNVNLLDIEHDVRDGLEDTRTNVITAGVRGEAGWRFPMAESFYVQPHVIAAYAYADVERLDMRDYDATFEDEQSMRTALGVRLGGGTDLSNGRLSRVKYWLTARAWEEYAEDGNVQFATGGDPLVIEDDISEGFEEVGLGVSLTGPDENLEVFLSGNVRSGDHTDGNNVTIGARLNW